MASTKRKKPAAITQPKKRGRPSGYSAEIADTICGLIAEGQSLRKICALNSMPAKITVLKWLAKHAEFAAQYAHAREEQAEHYAQEIIDIADEVPMRSIPSPDGGMDECIDSAGVQRNRLRVDARKWIASKLLPKKYGDKVQTEIGGMDGAPIAVNVQFVKPDGSD